MTRVTGDAPNETGIKDTSTDTVMLPLSRQQEGSMPISPGEPAMWGDEPAMWGDEPAFWRA